MHIWIPNSILKNIAALCLTVSFLAVIVGTYLLLVSYYEYQYHFNGENSRAEIMAKGYRAEGRVVDFEPISTTSSPIKNIICPVVEYKHMKTVFYHMDCQIKRAQMDDRYTIAYDPHRRHGTRVYDTEQPSAITLSYFDWPVDVLKSFKLSFMFIGLAIAMGILGWLVRARAIDS